MSFDPRALRSALGQFATGVTVVSIKDGDDVHGMTANSFTSVSLDPPLVLVCVDKGNATHEKIQEAGAFGVSVLREGQEGVSRFYAGDRSVDHGASWRDEATLAPVLTDAMAWFDCELWQAYDGGDHTIFVGKVLRYEGSEGRPLLFLGGSYRRVEP